MSTQTTTLRALASGSLVEVDTDTGVATLVLCDWLVRIPSGNTEPDFEDDLWTIVECGARTHHIEGGERWECEVGHRHGWTATAALEEWEREQHERRNGEDW